MAQRLSIFLFVGMIMLSEGGIFDSMYCGKHNCYEVMGLDRAVTKKEVLKQYRKLARELHPDQNKAEDAHEQFEILVSAYETLRNEATRKDYDYLLDNPDIYYEHFYRFFTTKTPKVDVGPVIGVTLAILSLLHYLHKLNSYNRALDYALHVPHLRSQAKTLAESEGLLERKFFKGMSKDEQKSAENKILRDIIEAKLDIKGGYQKPEWTNILVVQLLVAPFNLGKIAYFHVRRFYKYNLRGEEYDDEEKEYRTRTGAGLSATQWEMLTDEKRDTLYQKELWHEANRLAYLEERDELSRQAKANSSKYKQQKRMQKKDKVPDNWND